MCSRLKQTFRRSTLDYYCPNYISLFSSLTPILVLLLHIVAVLRKQIFNSTKRFKNNLVSQRDYKIDLNIDMDHLKRKLSQTKENLSS